MNASALAEATREEFEDFCRQVASGASAPRPEVERELRRLASAASDLDASAAASARLGNYRRAEVAALKQMTPEERLMRYRKGQLTVRQGWAWWHLYPREVPAVDGQPEWFARTLCDAADACSRPTRRDPGIELD